MAWLAFIMAIQLGSCSDVEYINTDRDMLNWGMRESSFFISMDSGIRLIGCIELKGKMKSYQAPRGNGFYDPFRIDYGLSASIKYKGFVFQYAHECDHPVISNNAMSSLPQYKKMSTEISIGYSCAIDIF